VGHFSVIEYSGKDSADVLSRIIGGGGKREIEIVDTEGHHPIGFQIVEQEEDDE
jgi:hypothetical protein